MSTNEYSTPDGAQQAGRATTRDILERHGVDCGDLSDRQLEAVTTYLLSIVHQMGWEPTMTSLGRAAKMVNDLRGTQIGRPA